MNDGFRAGLVFRLSLNVLKGSEDTEHLECSSDVIPFMKKKLNEKNMSGSTFYSLSTK